MTKNVFIVAAVATILATSVSAQNLIGRDTVAGDRNDDLIEAIEDDAERELDRFGNEGRPQGFTGSVALRGIVQSGNTDSTNIGIGSDINYVFGPNGIELQLNYAYSDDEDSASEETLLYGLEYTRDLNSDFFAFAKVQGSADSATDAQYETDTFVSFGAGYRVLNDADRQWSVQAGPGYRFAELTDVTEADVDEAAFGLSSDYAHKLNETMFVTNDTDIIWSETDAVVFNDLALNVSMTETLALRTSVLTEFHTEPGTAEDTDNTFGVSLVYSFN